jgi:hypothetical protein
MSTAKPRKSCGRVLLVFGTVLALLVLAGWWFLTDHKPGVAPEKARQELDTAVVGTFGSLSPPVVTAFDSYGSEPHYSNFHLAATPTGRAVFTRSQEVVTIVSPARAEKFRDELKAYWAKNGYSAVHEKFWEAQAGRTRVWTVTSPDGVSLRLEMEEFGQFHTSMLAAVDEVTSHISGDPFPMSLPNDPSARQPLHWSTLDDPYWSH